MVLRFATEDIFQRVANQIRDRFEVGDFGGGVVVGGSKRERCLYMFVAHKREHDNDALKPSLMGFPICMFSRQTDGPCCPIYSLLSSFGGAGASPSVSASVMGTSPSRVTGTKPYDVGMIAFGVSSPA